MKHIILTLAIAIITAAVASDEIVTDNQTVGDTQWRITTQTDEITDETSYYIVTFGSSVGNEVMSYRPDLVVRITPKGMTGNGGMRYVPEIMIQLGDFDHVDRHGCDLTLRYDKRKPLAETWIPSTDRRAMFSPDDVKTLKRLKVSTNLTARFTTTLGHVRTSTFNVAGLTNAIENVKARYIAATKSKGADGHEKQVRGPVKETLK